jgi:hypothetical protein
LHFASGVLNAWSMLSPWANGFIVRECGFVVVLKFWGMEVRCSRWLPWQRTTGSAHRLRRDGKPG